jgi:hypothetical protein
MIFSIYCMLRVNTILFFLMSILKNLSFTIYNTYISLIIYTSNSLLIQLISKFKIIVNLNNKVDYF